MPAAGFLFMPDMLTTRKLADVLRRSIPTVRAYLRSGRLSGRKVGRRWIVSSAESARYLESKNRPRK